MVSLVCCLCDPYIVISLLSIPMGFEHGSASQGYTQTKISWVYDSYAIIIPGFEDIDSQDYWLISLTDLYSHNLILL